MKNILIIGYGRGGKDTAAAYLEEKYEYKSISSSLFACITFIYDTLCPIIGYKTVEECYEDRHNFRTLWYELICAYTHNDKARLAREMQEDGFNLYVGMRGIDEFNECKRQKLFDLIIWIDGTERTGYIEDESSCTLGPSMADVIVYNNGSIEDLHSTLDHVCSEFQC